ncbi:MAG: cob(I)yrinic acid a,c-diamide adenosyltransferase [Nakamurella sp.]
MSADSSVVATAQLGPAMASTAEAAARVKAMTSPDDAPSRTMILTGDGKGKTTSADANLAGWQVARTQLTSGDYDLLVLDEVAFLVTLGWLDVADILDAIAHWSKRTSVVLTGRRMPPELIEIADTVTDLGGVKHAYQTGVIAQRGIEF